MSNPDQNFVGIVAGLPRSGTSMMMRMLEAGGMPVLTDNLRTADVDNPNGYYEFEQVKRPDQGWVDEAEGRFVKMVYKLIYKLPDHKRYKIVFMARNLDEVLRSQAAMLQRLTRGGHETDPAAEGQIKKIFAGELDHFFRFVASKPNMSLIRIDYGDVLNDRSATLARLPAFLGRDLDVAKMAEVCDPALHRQRA
jgi:hypothetical protein